MSNLPAEEAIDLNDLFAWEKPHMRLFLSADIIGSTAYKQKKTVKKPPEESEEDKYPPWFNMVLAFYHQAEQSFSRHWERAARDLSEKEECRAWCGEAPVMWKTVGDEVLFTKRIDHPMQALVCCQVWRATLEDIRRELQERGLDVKSSAWLADFPLRNQEVVLRRQVDRNQLKVDDDEYPYHNLLQLEKYYQEIGTGAFSDIFVLDYIGPSIDTGFRLGALSSSRKFVVSLELAHVLSTEQASGGRSTHYESRTPLHSVGIFELPKFMFRYDGRVPLKGVLNGDPYPVFWIDLDPENPLHVAEDAVLNVHKPAAAQIRELTRSIIRANLEYVCEPFFYQDDKLLTPSQGYSGLTAEEKKILWSRHNKFLETKENRDRENDIGENIPEDPSLTREARNLLIQALNPTEASPQQSTTSAEAPTLEQ